MQGICTEGVSKSFRRRLVLHELSFLAPAGEITFLAGLNGTGKTTWIRIALGLVPSDSGWVLFDGIGLAQARSNIAVVLDEPPVYPAMSGLSNLQALTGLPSVKRSDILSVAETLSMSPEFLKLKGREYSLGQRRRLAVASALLRRPRFLFLDEPTIGLDPLGWERVRDALENLTSSGCSVVVTGQDFADLEPIVSHVVALADGHAVFEGKAEDLASFGPQRVWVKTSEPESPVLACWTRDASSGLLEYECQTRAQAELILGQIRSSELQLSALGIRQASLQEALLAVIDRHGKEASANANVWA